MICSNKQVDVAPRFITPLLAKSCLVANFTPTILSEHLHTKYYGSKICREVGVTILDNNLTFSQTPDSDKFRIISNTLSDCKMLFCNHTPVHLNPKMLLVPASVFSKITTNKYPLLVQWYICWIFKPLQIKVITLQWSLWYTKSTNLQYTETLNTKPRIIIHQCNMVKLNISHFCYLCHCYKSFNKLNNF